MVAWCGQEDATKHNKTDRDETKEKGIIFVTDWATILFTSIYLFIF